MAFVGGLVALLILGGIVVGIVLVVRRVLGKKPAGAGDGGDVIGYLLMALAVGVAAFALAELAQVAFPGDAFIFDTEQTVAASLAALVVSVPIAGYLWRRLYTRRIESARSAGWTVYLAIIEAVFTTAFVISAVSVLTWILGDGDTPPWTGIIVFGGVVLFHELAARQTPPESDGADLPRVVGSAIGLVTVALGLGGGLYWVFDSIYASLAATAGGAEDVGIWISLIVVGAPLWWYRWLRPWHREPGTPRNVWLFLTSVSGLVAALGSVVWLATQTLVYLIDDVEPASRYFGTIPTLGSVGLVGLAIWWHHRSQMGSDRSDTVRAYEYAMAAIGLLTSIGGATGLTTLALGPSDLVDADMEATVAVAFVLVCTLAIWAWFWRRVSAAPREMEAGAGPRRFYVIGMAIITGLTSAGALIGTLVVLFQRMLGSSSGDTLVVQGSLFIYAGLATWHLLRTNAADKELIVSEEVITPFAVTVICSHPGMLAARFPKEANLRVLYRGDDAGVVSEEMADEIVAEVGHASSIVWVDDRGFRVAPAR
jgi:hypothetical protein